MKKSFMSIQKWAEHLSDLDLLNNIRCALAKRYCLRRLCVCEGVCVSVCTKN